MQRFIQAAAAALFLIAFVPVASAADFRVINSSGPSGDSESIEVTEFFWYGCPHCYRFAPVIEEWRQSKPDDVEFRHIPAVLSERWALHGRAFFAARALNVLDEFHMAMFRAMHEDGKRMRSEAEIREFVDSLGLDGEEFVGAMNSLGVNTRMQRARDLQQTYGVSGTPSVVIDGRYITSGSQAGSFERMIQVIDERVAAARGERD
jgi:thiol:disulfide interchange protein DsbA